MYLIGAEKLASKIAFFQRKLLPGGSYFIRKCPRVKCYACKDNVYTSVDFLYTVRALEIGGMIEKVVIEAILE